MLPPANEHHSASNSSPRARAATVRRMLGGALVSRYMAVWAAWAAGRHLPGMHIKVAAGHGAGSATARRGIRKRAIPRRLRLLRARGGAAATPSRRIVLRGAAIVYSQLRRIGRPIVGTIRGAGVRRRVRRCGLILRLSGTGQTLSQVLSQRRGVRAGVAVPGLLVVEAVAELPGLPVAGVVAVEAAVSV